MFWSKPNVDANKNPIHSEEYELLYKKLVDLDARIRIFETNLEMQRTDLANLRGKFNQRLKGLAEQEQKKEEEKENFNNDPYVPFG